MSICRLRALGMLTLALTIAETGGCSRPADKPAKTATLEEPVPAPRAVAEPATPAKPVDGPKLVASRRPRRTKKYCRPPRRSLPCQPPRPPNISTACR